MSMSRAHIVATIGPASYPPEVLRPMIAGGVDVTRFNGSWLDLEAAPHYFALVRQLAAETGRVVPILIDLPGPRVQHGKEHTYDPSQSCFTDRDRELVRFGIEHKVDYFGLSFVGSAKDVVECRTFIAEHEGDQRIIAKIERQVAVGVIDEILTATDAIMVARGDLGNEVPIEQLPFVQADLVARAKSAKKPVIVATQMMLSMTQNPIPTRAEITDVANAVLQGADAVMLSEETAQGVHPVEAVIIMEKVLREAERRMGSRLSINPL